MRQECPTGATLLLVGVLTSIVFQAVAPVAGMIMQDIMDACNPYSTTNILEIRGTEDDVTYYDGDPTNQDGWGAYQHSETMDFFVDLFGLVSEEPEELPNTDAPTAARWVTAWSTKRLVRGSNCTSHRGPRRPGAGATWTSMRAWWHGIFESTSTSTPLSISPTCHRLNQLCKARGICWGVLVSQCGRTTNDSFQRPSAQDFRAESDGRPPLQRHLHSDVRSVVDAVVRDRHGETVRFIGVDGRFE